MRMGQSNSKPAKRPGYYGYRCRYCGKYFQKLNELGNHVRFEHWRKWRMNEIPQLKAPKGGWLHLDKVSKIRRIIRGRYISIAYFLPKDWDVVKVWKLGEDEYGIILRIEPLRALSEVKQK